MHLLNNLAKTCGWLEPFCANFCIKDAKVTSWHLVTGSDMNEIYGCANRNTYE
jgi:hypothetical protein